MSKNIVLIGFMGAGKSAVARVLASRLNRRVVSTDEVIVAREGRPITDIFRDSGEPYFRQVERAVVAELAGQPDLIIDCGGGVVLNPNNVGVLKAGGVLVYLRAAPEIIYARVKDQSHRPLLNVPDPLGRIRDLLDQRRAHYAQADVIIDTDDLNIEQTAEQILRQVPA